MRPGLRDLTRLAELPPEDDPAGVALLIRSARQAPDEPLPLVKWRIRNTLRQRAKWSRRGLRLALVGTLVFLAGSVVGAIAVPLLRSRLRSAEPETTTSHRSTKAAPHSHRRVPARAIPSAPADEPPMTAEPSAVPAPTAPRETKSQVASDTSAPAKAALAPRPPVAAAAKASKVAVLRPSTALERTRVPPTGPESLAPPPIAEASPPPLVFGTLAGRIALRDSPVVIAREQISPAESRRVLASESGSSQKLSVPPSSVANLVQPPNEHSLLTIAVRRLRTAHDPASALAMLDDYKVRFPRGALAPEAAMLRAEALLQMGRKGDALAELDRLSLDQMPNSDERHVLRGELRATVGRWREALGDFDVVLRGHTRARADLDATTDMKVREPVERALWGRALARSRLGDDTGAREDLRDCLRLFPRGRFAPEATRLLGEHP
jgi:hypothetical protein